MKIDLTSLQFNSSLKDGVGTPSWGTSFGQSKPDYFLKNYDRESLVLGLVNNYNEHIQTNFRGENNIVLKSLFKNVILHVNGNKIKSNNPLILVVIEELSMSHRGRKSLKYNSDLYIDDTKIKFENSFLYNEISELLKERPTDKPCWFVYKIEYVEFDNSINLYIIKVDNIHKVYLNSKERKNEWEALIKDYDISYFNLDVDKDVENFQFEENKKSEYCFNKIYFGPPGTGKSHAIKEELKKLGAKGDNYSRVTFHPDYDYHSFVGGYKPFTDTEDEDKIKYKFVSQVFTDLYVKAWSNTSEDYYLVIEEINRGNCAEIFGDIFQLLDRNPEYNIEPSSELKAYLKEQENELNKDKTEEDAKVNLLFDGKLQMPNNLSILASMNTSDQSLYPMDSAFKRRWDWHYVPIDLKCTESNFTIKIDDTHQYSWLKFLEKVNQKIYNVTKSEDKQLGNWFINASISDNIISKEIFINKVLFYLWNDIFKDEVFNPDNIFIEKNKDGSKKRDISFNNFYNKDEQDRLLIHLLFDILSVPLVELEDKETAEYSQDNQVANEAAEPNEE